MRRIIAATLAVLAVLVAAPGAGAGEVQAQVPWVEQEGADVERCEGMSVMLRDRVSGGALAFGDALQPERTPVMPLDDPERYVVECFDGYLVGLETPPLALAGRPDTIAAEQQAAAAAMRAIAPGLEIVGRFSTVVNALHVRVGVAEAERLRAAGYTLEENGEVRASLAESVPLIEADEVWRSRGLTGEGVTIAVVDTGVDYSHPDLGGCLGSKWKLLDGVLPVGSCKVAGGYDVVEDDEDPMDVDGHGTQVAAIAAGDGEQPGVAPDATILAYRVMERGDWGNPADVIEGIERAMDPNRDGSVADRADIVTLALESMTGGPASQLSRAADGAVAAGSVVVAAAGNPTWRRADESNVKSPGTSLAAITVAASLKDDSVGFFSGRGPVVWDGRTAVKPDLVAPGYLICAARANEGTGESCGARRSSATGTSMAAAHVAGVAALMREAQPDISPEAVKAALKGSAVPLVPNQSVVAQGAGRVDADAGIAFIDGKPGDAPIATLDPVATEGITREIAGTVQATGLARWTLSYARYREPQLEETGWTPLVSSTNSPADRVLHRLAVESFPGGRYVLRLTVEDERGRTAVDHGYVGIEHLRLVSPQDRDVVRGGGVVPVEVGIEHELPDSRFALEYAPEGSSSWTEIWRGATPPAGWDTSGLPAGSYALRLTVDHHGITERQQVSVKLDPTLEPGWPVRVPLGRGCESFSDPCPLLAGWVDPLVDDLDGDGAREVVVFRYAPTPEVRAYGEDGRTLWVTPVGKLYEHHSAIYALHPFVAADVDGDGRREVLVYNISEQRLYVVGHDGAVERSLHAPLNGWAPVFPRLAVADVDADGDLDVVLSARVGGREKIVVLDPSDGRQLAAWYVGEGSAPFLFYSAEYAYAPALGDLDGDPELEIVAMDEIASQIHAFDWNGTYLPGWPVQGDPGSRPYAPPVIGDLDGDDANEVVAALILGSSSKTELHALRGDGAAMPGWPLRSQEHAMYGAPSLADLDGGGDLEIVAPSTLQTAVHRHDGSMLPGWPITHWGVGDYQAMIGDADGDGLADVLQHERSLAPGSLRAWSATGAGLPGFGMPLERSGRATISLGTFAGGRPMVVAASDSDITYEPSGKRVSKMRASIHVWPLVSSEIGAATWPTFQGDAGRTGSVSR